jgi:hypothetical protein
VTGGLSRQRAKGAKNTRENKKPFTAEAQRNAKENKSKTESEILKFFAAFLCAFAPLRL